MVNPSELPRSLRGVAVSTWSIVGVLVAVYVAYLAVIWMVEGQLPAIGEASGLDEARHHAAMATTRRQVSRDLAIIVAGMLPMSVGGCY